MVNTPIPHSLKSEAKKAAKILRDFTIPSAKVGPDKLIPAGLVVNAAGLAILTVAKLGFLITARGGSGIVIAKLNDGSWSPPSAIGIAGLGGGFEIGAEVTDFIIILNKRSAVDAFSKGGNLTLGGNFTIAAGPLGRNLEGDVSLRSPAAIYTYSRTRGLFAGISIEGSALIERKDANKKFYREPVRAYEILSGEVEQPPECFELYEVLEKHDSMFKKAALAYAKRAAVSEAKKAVAGGGILARVRSFKKAGRSHDNQGERQRSTSESLRQKRHHYPRNSDSDSDDDSIRTLRTKSMTAAARSRQSSMPSSGESQKLRSARKQTGSAGTTIGGRSVGPEKRMDPDAAWNENAKARALWEFTGQVPCDLHFKAGDEIEILTRTGHQEDWWEGSLQGRIGIFPANYVEVLS